MTNKNLIHVKLEYDKALESKKYVLSSERDLLKITQTLQEYYALRIGEFKLISKLHRKAKETITAIKKLQTTLPKSQSPPILHEDKNISFKTKIKNPEQDDLEYQLQEIQNKLKDLAR